MNRSTMTVVSFGLLVVAVDLLLKHTLVVGASNPNLGLGIDLGSRVAALAVHVVILALAMVAAARSDQLQRSMLIFLGVVSLSNLMDRVVYSGVRDYLNIFGIWFNLADLAIVSGFMAYLSCLIYSEHKAYHHRNRS